MLTALRLSAWGDVTRGLAENHRNFSCAASPPAAELWDPIPSHWCPGSSTLQGSAPPIPLHVSVSFNPCQPAAGSQVAAGG